MAPGLLRRSGDEVVQRQRVTVRVQLPADLHDFVVDRNIFANFEHGDVARQERPGAAEQQLMRQIDERRQPAGERVQPDREHGVVQRARADRVAAIGAGRGVRGVPIEQLVRDDLSFAIENRLPRHRDGLP